MERNWKLFDALSKMTCISNEQYKLKSSLIEKHFVNKEDKQFKAKQLGTVNATSAGKDTKRNETALAFIQVLQNNNLGLKP